VPAPASNAAPAGIRPLLDELGASFRSVARIATWAALGLVLAAVLFLTAGIVTASWRLLPVLSGSMEPAFGRGDGVLVERAPLSSVRVGDVIAYHVPVGDRHLTTHRVVAVLERGDRPVVRTKGDANPIDDPWEARLSGDGLWRVEASVPGVGQAYTLAGSTAARTLALWLMIGVVVAVLVRQVWRKDRSDARSRV
jgi:signal peptidase I